MQVEINGAPLNEKELHRLVEISLQSGLSMMKCLNNNYCEGIQFEGFKFEVIMIHPNANDNPL